jgi:predicted secreted protein
MPMAQKLNIAIEEKIIIQLPDLSTAGYSWEISGKFEDIVSVEKMTKEKSERTKTVGGQKDISFQITGLQKGKALLLFQQKRNWEDKVKADKEYEITVT